MPAAPQLKSEAVAGGATTTGQTLLAQLDISNTQATGYDRSLFNHWIDADNDGCDTRAEVLKAESLVPVTYSSGCTVATGQWYSWYDGATWTAASDVDIDHMVPLSEAWKSGASNWTADQRQAFANDLGYVHALEAVTDNVNQSKGDQDPAAWMPALDQCNYAIDWVSQKWRWNLSIDDNERSLLGTYLNADACGSKAVPLPDRMIGGDPSTQKYPLYKIVYDSTIFELVTNSDGTGTPTPRPLSFEKWRDLYNYQQPTPTSTDFVKYPWSPTVYAVTFWPGGENHWQWTPLSFDQWQRAGKPIPRIAGWIQGSYYYQWRTSAEIFVGSADGVKHKLTGAEWAASGNRPFENRVAEGFLKLTWAPEVARMTDVVNGAGRPLGYAEWQAEGFPTPSAVQRIWGDQFYKDCGSPTVWYAGPGMNRPVTFQEWQGAGSPSPTVNGTCSSPSPTPTPTQPPATVYYANCDAVRAAGAAPLYSWQPGYRPALDGDGNGIACQ